MSWVAVGALISVQVCRPLRTVLALGREILTVPLKGVNAKRRSVRAGDSGFPVTRVDPIAATCQ
jgi:hypothetical protein